MNRSNFQHSLEQLHTQIIQMGSLIETAIEDAITAFSTNDPPLCRAIMENDNRVDEAEKAIESKCLWLIAREQPVAGDLRRITTALKMVTDMERIGDHASDIAELTLRIADRNTFADSHHIPQMAAAATSMVRDAVTAYVNADLDLARATEERDDAVDDYFNLIKGELADIFGTQPQHIDHAIDLLLIAKYLERIADHAVNICQWVHFSQTGEHKHTLIF